MQTVDTRPFSQLGLGTRLDNIVCALSGICLVIYASVMRTYLIKPLWVSFTYQIS